MTLVASVWGILSEGKIPVSLYLIVLHVEAVLALSSH